MRSGCCASLRHRPQVLKALAGAHDVVAAPRDGERLRQTHEAVPVLLLAADAAAAEAQLASEAADTNALVVRGPALRAGMLSKSSDEKKWRSRWVEVARAPAPSSARRARVVGHGAPG